MGLKEIKLIMKRFIILNLFMSVNMKLMLIMIYKKINLFKFFETSYKPTIVDV